MKHISAKNFQGLGRESCFFPSLFQPVPSECGGAGKITASIEDLAVIRKILAHLDEKATLAGTSVLPRPAGVAFSLK